MVNIAVMGDYDSIYGFRALGVRVCPVSGPEEGVSLLKKLAEEKMAVIYITEALASEMTEALAAYDSLLLPAVIPIPGISGNTGIGLAQVRKSVERAVGSDIIFKDNS
ncbi:MAG: V-type ATP synthase subunit F [Lachnospiraceae bacterium]|nr:V-type ATP synthase subunit F [Lachnospiraceae bacterium]